MVNPAIAMDHSSNIVKAWRAARQKTQLHFAGKEAAVTEDKRWKPPAIGTLKLNVDASFDPGATKFSVGMVIRDSEGSFVEGRSMTLPRPASIYEAECIGVREALSWLMSYQD